MRIIFISRLFDFVTLSRKSSYEVINLDLFSSKIIKISLNLWRYEYHDRILNESKDI